MRLRADGKNNYLLGASLQERLEFYSMPEPNSGCLLWLGGTHGGRTPYGSVWDGERVRPAHVASWELHNNRKVPKGMCVCHKCDVFICIEPSHLWLGTVGENNSDRHAKGRSGSHKGTGNGRAKITEDQVRAIRRDPRHAKVVAEEVGLHWSMIYQIRQRRTWKHLP